MNNSARSAKTIAALFWAILLIAPLPGLSVYIAWMNELEQYGYILPLFIALIALVLFRWDYRSRLPQDPYGFALAIGGGFLSVIAAYRASPWVSAIAFSIIATAWLRSHWSKADPPQRLTYLAFLFVVLIRLPLNLDLRLTTELQRITSRASSYLLDALGITHYLRGNVLELPGGTLFVEEACSGVQSLFTVLFLACLWMVYQRRPIFSAPAYLLAGLCWAMVMNIFRITSIAVSQEWYQWDLSEGTAHEALGWICLGLALLMMLSTDRLLRVGFFPIPPDESGHLGNPVSRLWNWALSWGVEEEEAEPGHSGSSTFGQSAWIPPSQAAVVATLSFAALVCLPSLALGYRVIATRIATDLPEDSRSILWEPDDSLLASTDYATLVTNHQMLRDANDKQLGNHADVWTVMVDGTPVRLAVSQPYPEWHDMRNCYEGNGWQLNDWNPQLEPLKPSKQGQSGELSKLEMESLADWSVSYSEFVNESGGYGTLLFCGFARDGEWLTPPMTGLYSMVGNRIKDRSSLSTSVIMLQLWRESPKPPSPEQFMELQKLFETFRSSVMAEMRAEPSVQVDNVTQLIYTGARR